MALDESDRPHISYYGNGPLRYAYYNGMTWIIEIVDTQVGDAIYTSIELDSTGYPHISYFDPAGAPGYSGLKYARKTGEGWEITRVDTTMNTGWFSSLALDSTDRPHIAYLDWNNFDLKYAYITDVGLDLAGSVMESNVTLTWNDHPDAMEYWVYGAESGPYFTIGFDPLFENRLVVLSGDTNAWQTTGGVGNPNENWTFVIVAVDSGDLELERSNRFGIIDFGFEIR